MQVLKHLLFAGLLALSIAPMLPALMGGGQGPAPRFLMDGANASTFLQSSHPARYEQGFLPDHAAAPEVHAAAIVETADGGLLAVWYGGSREGASDVAIFGARLNKDGSDWQDLGVIVDTQGTSRDLGRGVSKLGNPVLLRDGGNRLWLFYVSVTVGGWSGSSINARISSDHGVTWGPAKRLVTSPFFNVSTLVKGAPFLYEDGTIGLPVYHEFIGKFGELLRLDREGRVLDKSRITSGRGSLQPVVVTTSASDGVALLRDAGHGRGCVVRSETRDGGLTWSPAERTNLPNPNSAVAALPLFDGRIVMISNPLEKNRFRLSLSVSGDRGRTWQEIHVVEEGEPLLPSGQRRQFSYPYLIRTAAGDVHLLYTWNKSRIRHIRFNDAWLDGVSGKTGRQQAASGDPHG